METKKSISASELKSAINEVKTLLKEKTNVTDEERKIMRDLMQVLRFAVEFDILEECFSNNANMMSVVADIDTKLISLDNERKEIISEPDSADKNIRLISLAISKNRLIEVKKSIQTKDFDFYTESMSNNITSGNALIAACYNILSSGFEDYSYLFGESLASGTSIGTEAIDKIFSIIHNTDLQKELEGYFNAEKVYQDHVEHVNDNNEYIRYLELAKENEGLLKDYIELRTLTSESVLRHEIELRNRIDVTTIELDNMPDSHMMRLVSTRRRNDLESIIATSTQELDKIMRNKLRKEEVAEKLREAGLGKVIDCYGRVIEGARGIEERVAEFLKASLRRTSLDITGAKMRLEESNKKIAGLNVRANQAIDNYKSTMSSYGRELVTEYHDDVKKIIELLKDKSKKDNLITIYVLRILAESKNLSYQDVNEICNLKVGTEKLAEGYEKMITNLASSLQDDLAELEERDIYDLSAFLKPQETDTPRFGSK